MGTREIVNRLRLGSGLVLLVYVFAHLTNHAFGIVSLEVMDAGRAVTILPWRTLPGTVLLYGAAVTHVAGLVGALPAHPAFAEMLALENRLAGLGHHHGVVHIVIERIAVGEIL